MRQPLTEVCKSGLAFSHVYQDDPLSIQDAAHLTRALTEIDPRHYRYTISLTLEGSSLLWTTPAVNTRLTVHELRRLLKNPGVSALVVQDEDKRMVATAACGDPEMEINWNTIFAPGVTHKAAVGVLRKAFEDPDGA